MEYLIFISAVVGLGAIAAGVMWFAVWMGDRQAKCNTKSEKKKDNGNNKI